MKSLPSTKSSLLAALAVFMVIFNLGYVFHDLLLDEWFHQQQPFAREHYIIPYIALAFAAYALILAHLFPSYHAARPARSVWSNGLRFGLMMGVVFDATQGGIIEVATFEMPLSVFLVDSSYHVLVEGSVAGLVLAAVYQRLWLRAAEHKPLPVSVTSAAV